MEKPSSVLFAGLRFNKKRFSGDIARFKLKEEEEELTAYPALGPPAPAAASGIRKNKKRKRKDEAPDIVEGFSVFKSCKSKRKAREVEEEEAVEVEEREQRKEAEKQIEKAAILRKKFGIHISGLNVPCPIESFTELSSRYGCKPYLLHNLFERGFKEPTPIQRQAIPVLLSGRDCFACAPTGSGKTLAFLCPILMKLKDPRMA